MSFFDNKSIIIIGLILGGLLSLYSHQTELASAIFGGLVGYLSKDYVYKRDEEDSSEDGSDLESP